MGVEAMGWPHAGVKPHNVTPGVEPLGVVVEETGGSCADPCSLNSAGLGKGTWGLMVRREVWRRHRRVKNKTAVINFGPLVSGGVGWGGKCVPPKLSPPQICFSNVTEVDGAEIINPTQKCLGSLGSQKTAGWLAAAYYGIMAKILCGFIFEQ